MPGMDKRQMGGSSTQRTTVAGSNIYEGMVTRNLTEHTYTTTVDGIGVAVHPLARMSAGGDLKRSETPIFSARQPKGMLLRSATEPPVMVHGNPYAGYVASKQ